MEFSGSLDKVPIWGKWKNILDRGKNREIDFMKKLARVTSKKNIPIFEALDDLKPADKAKIAFENQSRLSCNCA